MAQTDGVLRRDEILRVAARVFRTKGYRTATLNDISDEFGFTRAALYYYFKSKEEILQAIIENAGNELTAELERAAGMDDPPSEKIGRILCSHATLILTDVNIFGVYLSEMKSLPPKVREKLEAGERHYVDQLAVCIQEGIDRGDFEDVPAKTAALALVGMTNSAIRWYKRGRGMGPEEFGQLVSHLGVKALQATSDRTLPPGPKRRPAVRK